MRLFNVRVPDWLDTLLDEAAELAGQNRSEFGREALEAAARRQIAEATRPAAEPRTPARVFVVGQGYCRHPVDAIVETSRGAFCSRCNRVV